MKYYAGIDPSFAGTAIVILDDKYNIVEEIKFTAKSKTFALILSNRNSN